MKTHNLLFIFQIKICKWIHQRFLDATFHSNLLINLLLPINICLRIKIYKSLAL